MVKDQFTESKAAYEGLVFKNTSEILNSISMFSAFLVVCMVIYLRKKHKKVSNRVSLRLQSYVSTVDMFFAAFQIMTVNSNPPGNWVCHVSPWGFVFTALLGCFYSVAIAFNLQIIFVYNYLSTRHFEKFYIIVPIILAFTLSIVPVLFDALGYDKEEVSCWYKRGNTTQSVIWQWTTLHGWIILSVLYCTYAVFTIINRLHKATKFMKEMNNTNSNNNFIKNNNCKRQLMVNRAVKRIVVYPIVPIITFLFNIASNLLFFSTKQNHFTFQMLANIGTSSQGIFNALAFCFDPAMKKIWINGLNRVKLFLNNNDEKKIDIKKNNNNDDESNNNNDDDSNNNSNDDDEKKTQTVTAVNTSFTNTTIVSDNDDDINYDINNENNNNDDDDNVHVNVDSNDSNDSNDYSNDNIIRLSKDEEYILALL
ncbi:hypothetical protein RhiirA1_496295 [Rhizophagus irregularis]|uniref:G-protein coupled receptors family 2 profile 2 domain-containing protein n=1 Tax=Rhizophagus irregularis TaxID=588596 RepID=A0A2I1DYS0_9GLOM|nr:hypothetical protein RhiirA1_496295 [Rhizophagus irregularis]PKY15018.1 hypothetical protein RhiirB3_520065 [Rhizophagus irregularis]CAB4487442.1 unnamed protein product [Rhizophagus irregularis]CAB5364076.1 unnamed protein product [Rhizophagus irregularis]